MILSIKYIIKRITIVIFFIFISNHTYHTPMMLSSLGIHDNHLKIKKKQEKNVNLFQLKLKYKLHVLNISKIFKILKI